MLKKRKMILDPIAEARKNKNFPIRSKVVRAQIRLAVKIYEKRKQKKWSQTELAKEIHTTQKVISNIESGDVNISIGLLKRLVDGLNLSNDDLGNIFESCHLFSLQSSTINQKSNYTIENSKQYTYQFNYSTANI